MKNEDVIRQGGGPTTRTRELDRDVAPPTGRKLAGALGVDPEDLVTWDGDPEPTEER